MVLIHHIWINAENREHDSNLIKSTTVSTKNSKATKKFLELNAFGRTD